MRIPKSVLGFLIVVSCFNTLGRYCKTLGKPAYTMLVLPDCRGAHLCAAPESSLIHGRLGSIEEAGARQWVWAIRFSGVQAIGHGNVSET